MLHCAAAPSLVHANPKGATVARETKRRFRSKRRLPRTSAERDRTVVIKPSGGATKQLDDGIGVNQPGSGVSQGRRKEQREPLPSYLASGMAIFSNHGVTFSRWLFRGDRIIELG